LERVVRLALNSGQRERAVQAVELAQVHAPDHPDVLAMVVLVDSRVRMDLPGALAAAERRLELNPAAHGAYLDLASLCIVHGHSDRARALMGAMRAAGPPSPEHELYRLVLLLCMGQDPQALGPALLDAYRALPPGTAPDAPWPLLRAHVEATLDSGRVDRVLALFTALAQPDDNQGIDRLQALLSP
jgi:hypothetical protein